MSNPVKSASSQLDRVEQLLDQHNVRKAADTLESIRFTPDASGARLVELLKRTANVATDTNVPSVVMRAARQLLGCKAPPLEVATLYAKAGELNQARTALGNDRTPEQDALLLAHVIDWNIATRKSGTLPEEHRPSAEAFLKALKAYDAKDNAGAREALQAIGATSPLIEWKLFLRGLMAWTENDDERANENFRRLNPDRLPARLAGVVTDPALLSKATPSAGAMGQLIKDWRKAIAKQQPFAPLFRNFKRLMPNLTEHEKALLPRLARCYYAEIQRSGQPDDTKAYKEVFGLPPLDPDFDRLHATVLEKLDELALSQKHWSKYAAWVAKAKPWPKPINDMVLAIIKNNEGELTRDSQEQSGDGELYEQIRRMMMNDQKGLVIPKQEKPLGIAEARRFWQESHHLAPDWHTPVTNLLISAETETERRQAMQLCEDFLQRNPTDAKMRQLLALGYFSAQQFPDAARHLKEAVALDPLNTELAERYDSIQVIVLVSLFGKQPLAAILAEVVRFQQERKQVTEAPFSLLQHVLETYDGSPSDNKLDDSKLVTAGLLRVMFSVLYKAKPAVKTKIKAAFTATAEAEQNPLNLLKAIHMLTLTTTAGVKFTGQGVMEKQLTTLIVERLLAEKTITLIEETVTIIVESGVTGPQIKAMLKKLADKYKQNLILNVYELDYRLKNSSKEPSSRDNEQWCQLNHQCRKSVAERYKAMQPKLNEMKETYGFELYGVGWGWYAD
jgi:tetratricopeptide (TPR) repeat protein